jgi:hypothetical protein|tara:strand:- start:5937 stop:6176 length:240 start_codon:yes stop_codon:yes gene_type:complete
MPDQHGEIMKTLGELTASTTSIHGDIKEVKEDVKLFKRDFDTRLRVTETTLSRIKGAVGVVSGISAGLFTLTLKKLGLF